MDVDFLYEKVKSFFARENLLSKIEIAKERAQRRIVIYLLPDQKALHDYSPPQPFLSVPQDFTQHRDRPLPHPHLGVTSEKYFQCTECPFNCKGASDFANHLVVHSVEQRDQNKQMLNKGGYLDHDPRRCQFHEGPCDNPAVCDFLAKERRDQQILMKQQQTHHSHQQSQNHHQMGRARGEKELQERNGHEILPMGEEQRSKVEQRAQLTPNCVMEVDAHQADAGRPKVWEMQPMKSSYNSLDCRVCGFSFFHKKDLKKHMMIHTGEKPYQCHLCGKAFASATVLNKHITNHNQNKPFKCNKCNRAFSTQDKLDKHLVLHDSNSNRSDSFVCTTCSVPFTRYSNLMRHCLAQNHPAPLINREKGRRPKDKSDSGGSDELTHHQQQQSVDEVSKSMKKKDCLKWTELEDSWLLSGVREFGKGHWKQILEKYRSYFQYGRNRFTLRLRYAYLCKTGRIELGVEPSLVPENHDKMIAEAAS